MILNEFYPVDNSRMMELEHSQNVPFKIELKRTPLFQKELDAFFKEFEDLELASEPKDSDESPTTTHVDKHPSLEQMTFIYIVSNDIYSERNMYKIGKHKGTKKMLIKRYKTYLIDPIVYFFFPTGTVSQDEVNLLDRFSKFRMGTSEFLQIPIDKLIENVQIYFKHKYQRCPTVQIPYHRCLYTHLETLSTCREFGTGQILYDFFSKNVQLKKCFFYPYLEYHDPSNCLKSLEFIVYS